MITDLPYTLTVDGEEKEIYCDFRDVILVCNAFNDPDLSQSEKNRVMLEMIYVDNWWEFKDIDGAIKQAIWLIDWGKEYKEKENGPRIMDWEQDFPYIIAPINRVIGHEVRSDKHLHWWTFLSAYMEIGECTFSNIVHIRDMKHRGKKMDAADKEWYMRNRDLVDLKTKYTTADEEMLKKWSGG